MSNSFGLKMSRPSLDPGLSSSSAAMDTWLTQPPPSRGESVFAFVFVFAFCISLVFLYLGFNGCSVYQDNPHCHHGRMLLCNGHHRELYQRANLQKVNNIFLTRELWKICMFDYKILSANCLTFYKTMTVRLQPIIQCLLYLTITTVTPNIAYLRIAYW